MSVAVVLIGLSVAIWLTRKADGTEKLAGARLVADFEPAGALVMACQELAGQAPQTLAEIVQAVDRRAPLILRMLTAAKPRMPDLRPGLRTIGGEDEAWSYREDWLSLWEATGALDWLKRMAGKR